MGGSRYSDSDYEDRASYRSSTGTPTFDYDSKIKSGSVAAKVHPTLNPKGVKIRESRDSAGQEKVPIAVILDTTGSMLSVPAMIQEALPKLMGGFLKDKASGKKYLGDIGYPDIMIGAVDDYYAQYGFYGGPDHDGTLQIGQFESGMEIDDNITNLWMTGNGGGTYQESYDMALYFLARHTSHDHWEKRGRKGYMFIIGDEHCYPKVDKEAVKTVIGDGIQSDIPISDIIKEVKERYHLFFILPNMTSHYSDKSLEKYWVDLVGQQNFLRLEDPSQITELIVSAVAICESHVTLEELAEDCVGAGCVSTALAPLAKGVVGKVAVDNLPAVGGKAGRATRI